MSLHTNPAGGVKHTSAELILASGNLCTTSCPPSFLCFWSEEEGGVCLANVNAMEVVCAEGCVALGTLSLTGVVASLDALEAEDVEALCQHGVLHPRVAARTGQASLRDGGERNDQSHGPFLSPDERITKGWMEISGAATVPCA